MFLTTLQYFFRAQAVFCQILLNVAEILRNSARIRRFLCRVLGKSEKQKMKICRNSKSRRIPTHPGRLPDASRTQPGRIRAASWTHPGPILDPSWIRPGHPGPIRDPSWTHPGPILDPSWNHPGPIRLVFSRVPKPGGGGNLRAIHTGS